ncbi:MAG: proline dehydrogenase family protein, partial [Desulfobacterales bacterium]|nr:proline dehydrogenase family protein [Desulfobacterales bacterium]
VRLCKGAYYWEERSVVYKDGTIINASYVHLLEHLLTSGAFVGIATHDEKLVFEALRLIHLHGIPREQYEFQMLYGVEEELRSILTAQGHRVRVYVPFGREWFAYSVRRLRENPRMVGHVFSQFLGRFTRLFQRN